MNYTAENICNIAALMSSVILTIIVILHDFLHKTDKNLKHCEMLRFNHACLFSTYDMTENKAIEDSRLCPTRNTLCASTAKLHRVRRGLQPRDVSQR